MSSDTDSAAPEDELASAVQAALNATGFPLQLYLDHLVENRARNTDRETYSFAVAASEFPWRSLDGSSSGFVDSILLGSHQGMFSEPMVQLIIEAKRFEVGVAWIFLVSANDRQRRSTSDAYLLRGSPTPAGYSLKWRLYSAVPMSPSPSFCTVRNLRTKAKHGESPEDVAGELLAACEAIAEQTRHLPMAHTSAYTHLPVIVTNAPLFVATFAPSEVEPSAGIYPRRYDAELAPWVRFQKSFSSSHAAEGDAIHEVAESLQRTVFVVTAAHFEEFLGSMSRIRLIGGG